MQWFKHLPLRSHACRKCHQITFAKAYWRAACWRNDAFSFKDVGDLLLWKRPRKCGNFFFPSWPFADVKFIEALLARIFFYADL